LSHPNICTIFGVEDFAGKPSIVMELLEGEFSRQAETGRPLRPKILFPSRIRVYGISPSMPRMPPASSS
jgi:hypothetical protein